MDTLFIPLLERIASTIMVIQKIFAGRERDHDDVRRLLRKQKNLDREYIEAWLRDFGASTDQDLVAAFRRLG